MNIIYGYSNCSDNKYNELFNNSFVLRADQKYHSLLIEGLNKNGCNVTCYSGLPINRDCYSKLIVNENDEFINGVKYHYYKTINLPLIRQLMIFINGFISVLKNSDCYLVCDYQNLSNAYGMLLASKLKGIKSSLIVMDLPIYITSNKVSKLLYDLPFKLANSYILLTKQMNDVVNKNNKPYVVIEGIGEVKDNKITKYKENIVMYAGSIHKKYGIEDLVNGFIKTKLKDTYLWIYGDGDYKEELISISKKHKNVVYKGLVSNKEVVDEESKVSLLVNPRPTNEEYTKYSFPSKTIEYMSSGTPLLTTRLPGIPDKYFDYVYVIDDDIKKALLDVFSINKASRTRLANKAKTFIKDYKNNITQARKVIGVLECLK